MPEPDDIGLLTEYARHNSEEAFTALVERHVNLVYSVALRSVGHSHAAEEIAQAVFIILARKARSLSKRTVLSGWLYQTTRLTAANSLRTEIRRQKREQEAYMQTTLNEPVPEAWPQIAPLLDDALERLGEKDRNAIVLRFFENKNLREVGTALGASEDAAKMRLNRALEKLRKFFTRRGVTLSAVAIAGAVSARSVQAAPVGLAKAITPVALAKGAAAGGTTLALVKGTLNLMAWTKAKAAIVIGAGILFAAGTVATTSKWFWFSGNEIQFEAEGTVTYATAPDPRGSYTNTKHFIVARVGKIWKIRTITEKEERTGPGGPIADAVDLYYEMSFDGTNIYRFIQQDKNKILSTVPPDERGKWVFAEGDVEKVDSPPGNDVHNLYPVWLAYCSAPYFKNLNGDKAVSPAFATRDFIGEPIAKMQSPAKWNMHDQSFVKDVSWLSDGTYEAVMPDGKETTRKYEPPYDTAFVWGHFENLSWTNWNGIYVPNGFKITVYQPDYTSKTAAHFAVVYTFTGTLGEIRKVNNFSAVPKLTTKTHITDWRDERKNQPARYVSTNRWDYSAATR